MCALVLSWHAWNADGKGKGEGRRMSPWAPVAVCKKGGGLKHPLGVCEMAKRRRLARVWCWASTWASRGCRRGWPRAGRRACCGTWCCSSRAARRAPPAPCSRSRLLWCGVLCAGARVLSSGAFGSRPMPLVRAVRVCAAGALACAQLLDGDYVRAEARVMPGGAADAAASAGVHKAVLKKDDPLGWGTCVLRVMTNRRINWQSK